MISTKKLEMIIPTKGYSHLDLADKMNASLKIMAALDDLLVRFDEDAVEIIISIEAKGNG